MARPGLTKGLLLRIQTCLEIALTLKGLGSRTIEAASGSRVARAAKNVVRIYIYTDRIGGVQRRSFVLSPVVLCIIISMAQND